MKKLKVILFSFVLATLTLMSGGAALASENQQDGYHYDSSPVDRYGDGAWTDDACLSSATKKFSAYFYNAANYEVPWTRICHNELDFACNDCVPSLEPELSQPPCITCGWGHNRLNDRTTRIQVTYVPPNKCIRVWEDINPQYPDDNYILRQGGGEFKGLGFYQAETHFVNDWISAVTLVGC